MKDKLLKLLDNAYAPYSNFHVACLLEMKDGRMVPGVNVENAAYGSSICSERSAILSAISNGYTKGDFKELHCMCADSNRVSTSCFGCRQVISELFDKDVPLYFYANTGESKMYTVKELCPYPFDEDDLK